MEADIITQDELIARRRDEAIRRALNTPPQPNPTKNSKAVKTAVETNAEKRELTGEAF